MNLETTPSAASRGVYRAPWGTARPARRSSEAKARRLSIATSGKHMRFAKCDVVWRTSAVRGAMIRHLVSWSSRRMIGCSSFAVAKTPPTERELRVYAGFTMRPLAATRLRSRSSSPQARNPTSRTATAARRCTSPPSFTNMPSRERCCAWRRSECARRPDVTTSSPLRPSNDLEMLKIALDGGGNARAITSPYAARR